MRKIVVNGGLKFKRIGALPSRRVGAQRYAKNLRSHLEDIQAFDQNPDLGVLTLY
ncbi:MAG: hypothetical protein HWQ40_21045 [Nostoc sp. NMS9]|nr:hypothetical protein [Nostoc sp. NMS9]